MSKAMASHIDDDRIPSKECPEEKGEMKRPEEGERPQTYCIVSRPFIRHIPSFSEEECIFIVHDGLRGTNPAAYTPMLISIGPYFAPQPPRRNIMNLKQRYLQSFLRRAEGRLSEENILKKLEDLESRALSYYGDPIRMHKDEFLKMLLIDGCFVVEFVARSKSTNGCDPILMPDWMELQIVRDMLLLENQLPFFVLNELYQLIIDTTEDRVPFLNLVKLTFSDMLPKLRYFSLILNEVNDQEIKHLLQVVHILCRPVNKEPAGGIYNGQHQLQVSMRDPCVESCHIRSATELQEAGVQFKRDDYSCHNTSLFDVRFNDGILEIPSFKLGDSTVTFFKNLIAYEQHSCDVYPKYFSDYVIFMDDLINTEMDVSVLRLNGIILNGLGNDKAVANLFNHLSKWVVYSSRDYCYANVCYKLIQHCNKPKNVLISKLRRDYFHTPWAGIATVAAILLLLLTATQTITSVLGLYR